jgi:hypothetical protein
MFIPGTVQPLSNRIDPNAISADIIELVNLCQEAYLPPPTVEMQNKPKVAVGQLRRIVRLQKDIIELLRTTPATTERPGLQAPFPFQHLSSYESDLKDQKAELMRFSKTLGTTRQQAHISSYIASRYSAMPVYETA